MSIGLAVLSGFKMVPRWVWLLLGAAILYALAANWHADKKEAFGDERYAEGRADRDAEIEALRRQINQRNAELAAALRSKHNEEIRRVAADADALRVRGPGKATCAGAAFLPPAAGGRVKADGAGDASVGEVSAGERVELIGLPFAPTVDFAEQHDAFRAEALSWREWHARFTAEWEAYRAKSR